MNAVEFAKEYKLGIMDINNIINEDAHLSFVEKITKAENIAKKSCTDENGKFRINSIMNYYFSTIDLLRTFTSLEGFNDGKEMLENYEALDECGALSEILNAIDERERADFLTTVKMATEDYIANHGNALAQISDMIDSFGSSLSSLVENLSPEEKGKIIDLVKARANKEV